MSPKSIALVLILAVIPSLMIFAPHTVVSMVGGYFAGLCAAFMVFFLTYKRY